MCGAMVGCVVCEGYVFLIKKLHIYFGNHTYTQLSILLYDFVSH